MRKSAEVCQRPVLTYHSTPVSFPTEVRTDDFMFLVVWVLLVLRGARFAGACDNPQSVQISGEAGVRSHFDPNKKNYHLATTISSSVDIFCTGSLAKDLIISIDSVPLASETIDTITVKLTLRKLEMNNYVVTCTDVKTTCNASLSLMVGPDVVIISKSARQKRLPAFTSFFVPITEDYEVVCCGDQADSLQILSPPFQRIESAAVNETCIKSIKLDTSKEVKWYPYSCPIRHSASFIETTVIVYIDYPPTATDFWCIEYKERVNCSWTATGFDTTFSLLYVDEYGNFLRVCEDLTTKKTTRLCEWDIFNAKMRGSEIGGRLRFVLQSCNLIICNNQTFDINRNTIQKADPPRDLKFLEIGTYNAKFQWSDAYEDEAKYYKIMYRLAETEWQIFDPSSIHVKNNNGITDYSLDLKLPCNEGLYEVKVYARYTKTSQSSDAYWSDPASISSYTDSQGDSAGAYAVKQLRRDLLKSRAKLCKKVNALGKKLAALEEDIRSSKLSSP